MVWCKNCKSIKVKVNNLNFAEAKAEGEPSVKYTYNKFSFFCHDCENQWESIPEAEEIYFRYVDLKAKTQLTVYDVNEYKNSPLPIVPLSIVDLTKRKELAKEIIEHYRHVLDIDPGEWYEIKQDAF